jgi:hypothetical protein
MFVESIMEAESIHATNRATLPQQASPAGTVEENLTIPRSFYWGWPWCLPNFGTLVT